MVRKKRNAFQKLSSRAVYRCDDCGATQSVRRSFFAIFNQYSECPSCGTRDLSRLAAKDKIDRMSRNPLRRCLFLVGCPIYHCTFCRLQFRDWRKLQSDNKRARTSPA